MALARTHTFVASALLEAAQLNAELDNLVKTLNGTQTTAEITIKSSVGAPTLTVNQMTGAQHIMLFQASTVTKCQVNKDGQFESLLATGTAPLKVASTTMIPNLNADQLDGVEGAGYLLKDFAGETVFSTGQAGPIIRITAASGDAGFEAESALGRFRWLTNGARHVLQHYDGSAWDDVAQTIGATNAKRFGDHTGAEYATQAYVNAKLTTLAFGVFYNGEPTTTSKQPRYVVPANIESASILKVEYVLGIVGTGTTSIKLEHFDSVGASQGSATISITAAKSADTTYSDDITDMTLSAGDFLVWTVTGDAGTQQDISIWAHGVQEVI